MAKMNNQKNDDNVSFFDDFKNIIMDMDKKGSNMYNEFKDTAFMAKEFQKIYKNKFFDNKKRQLDCYFAIGAEISESHKVLSTIDIKDFVSFIKHMAQIMYIRLKDDKIEVETRSATSKSTIGIKEQSEAAIERMRHTIKPKHFEFLKMIVEEFYNRLNQVDEDVKDRENNLSDYNKYCIHYNKSIYNRGTHSELKKKGIIISKKKFNIKKIKQNEFCENYDENDIIDNETPIQYTPRKNLTYIKYNNKPYCMLKKSYIGMFKIFTSFDKNKKKGECKNNFENNSQECEFFYPIICQPGIFYINEKNYIKRFNEVKSGVVSNYELKKSRMVTLVDEDGTKKGKKEQIYDLVGEDDEDEDDEKKNDEKKNNNNRNHQGIHQRGGKKGKLKKGYKYSGKRLKSGLPQIIKCKCKKSKILKNQKKKQK
jgi:hypothetical protein